MARRWRHAELPPCRRVDQRTPGRGPGDAVSPGRTAHRRAVEWRPPSNVGTVASTCPLSTRVPDEYLAGTAGRSQPPRLRLSLDDPLPVSEQIRRRSRAYPSSAAVVL